MAHVTIQILDGVDRGKVYPDLPTTVTVGREEGNAIQLNDERVSRYHAKIQEDQGQLVLTDLESTNGTRVNGEPTQVTILRVGDRISVGRTVLLVGSPQEIDQMVGGAPRATTGRHTMQDPLVSVGDKTRPASLTNPYGEEMRSDELKFQLNHFAEGEPPAARRTDEEEVTPRVAPPLPARLSPAQAAQLTEMLLFLHQRIASVTESAHENADDGAVTLNKNAWQRILRVEMELARYLYRIGHPD